MACAFRRAEFAQFRCKFCASEVQCAPPPELDAARDFLFSPGANLFASMNKRARVFVVEDHPATARGLKVFLELAGYTVTVATDMRSALRTADGLTFDVLVCDLHLPDGTGWELMETLRAKSPVRGIVFSAFDEAEHVARSKAAGFDEHVVKGTTPEALLAAIDRVARFELPTAAAKPDVTQMADHAAICEGKSEKRRPARPRKVNATKARA